MNSTLATSQEEAVFSAVHAGLTVSSKSLPAWLFYDQAGSQLFEQITELPEYYVTRAERSIFVERADEIIASTVLEGTATLTVVELGAGTASKTGLLLTAAVKRHIRILYQPVDVSESALIEALETLSSTIPSVEVRYQVADYTREPLCISRVYNVPTLALYIGSSIGNFKPGQANAVLLNLRSQLRSGDMLLFSTDLTPGPRKSVHQLLRAYNDAEGVTAAFNRNVLTRLNRELGADFDVDNFQHIAKWNAQESRIEMHLRSESKQTVSIRGLPSIKFAEGETIHTENSYKFTVDSIAVLLRDSGFVPTKTWKDADGLVAVTLARAV